MRAYFTLLCIFLGLSIFTITPSYADSPYQQGVHYEVIEKSFAVPPPKGKVEVLEFFSWGCIHCYHFEPILTDWSDKNSEKITLKKVPVTFNQSFELLATYFYIAKAFDILNDVSLPVFSLLHQQKKSGTVENILPIFEQSLSNKKKSTENLLTDFNALIDSFAIQAQVRQAEKKAMQFKIRGVPTLIINQQYRLSQNKDVPDFDTMLMVADYLIDSLKQQKK